MNKDQSKRKMQIAMLECVADKNAAAIKHQRLTLERMEAKQINRLAELRCQKLLLEISERAARCPNV
jgi:hypothetical protein